MFFFSWKSFFVWIMPFIWGLFFKALNRVQNLRHHKIANDLVFELFFITKAKVPKIEVIVIVCPLDYRVVSYAICKIKFGDQKRAAPQILVPNSLVYMGIHSMNFIQYFGNFLNRLHWPNLSSRPKLRYLFILEVHVKWNVIL